MGLLDKLFGGREHAETDDERELREYEAYYSPQSGVTDSTHAEFVVGDVFSINGGATVATGTVTGGVFSVGDRVVIVHGSTEILSEIAAIEQFHKMCDRVSEGANAGFMLKNVQKKQISRNDIIKKISKE